MNPDRSQFDVPAGMKKVTEQQAKQQVDAFAATLRSFEDVLNGAPPAPAAVIVDKSPPPEKKASRKRR